MCFASNSIVVLLVVILVVVSKNTFGHPELLRSPDSTGWHMSTSHRACEFARHCSGPLAVMADRSLLSGHRHVEWCYGIPCLACSGPLAVMADRSFVCLFCFAFKSSSQRCRPVMHTYTRTHTHTLSHPHHNVEAVKFGLLAIKNLAASNAALRAQLDELGA